MITSSFLQFLSASRIYLLLNPISISGPSISAGRFSLILPTEVEQSIWTLPFEINNFTVEFLNKKDRRTKRYTQIAKIKFAYSIAKNITTQPGIKTIYLRILRPDGEILQKSPEHIFQFENTELLYSLKKDFEYAGEPINDELYWTVEEILPIGEYSADFFIDGRQIARYNFRIEK